MKKTNIIFDSFIYYVSILLAILVSMTLFVLLFSDSSVTQINSIGERLIYWSKYLWFSGFLVAVTNLIGLLVFGSPLKKDINNIRVLSNHGWVQNKKLIISYVSKGENYNALNRSITETKKILDRYKVNYEIEVVTDTRVDHLIPKSARTSFHLVPEQYSTPRVAKYKARALHYLIGSRNHQKYAEPVDTWILHLDEESVLTESALAGILKFIINRQNSNSIGQGEIKYNSFRYGQHFFITVADSIRTGDDLGRFRFQYNIFQRPLFV